MKYYSIQAVSEMSGLSSHCIRAWEKRYGAIKPERSENGRRVYSESELNRLQMLGKLSSLGNSISLIANLSDEELEKMLVKMSHGRTRIEHIPEHKGLVEPKLYLNNLFMALSNYKLDVLTHELSKASMDLSYRDFALEVVAGLFRKVGEYVHEGHMSIAQEHTLSALTKFFIGRRIGQHYLKTPKNKLKIIMATPSGEHHTIGLMLSALLMAEHSVNFIYLGEDLPEVSIAEAARATGSDVVLLAVSSVYSKTHDINQVVSKLRDKLLPMTKIWVGGDTRQLSAACLRESRVTPFESLEKLDSYVAQLVTNE